MPKTPVDSQSPVEILSLQNSRQYLRFRKNIGLFTLENDVFVENFNYLELKGWFSMNDVMETKNKAFFN